MPDLYVVTDGVEPIRVSDSEGLALEVLAGCAAGRIFRTSVNQFPIGIVGGFVDVTEVDEGEARAVVEPEPDVLKPPSPSPTDGPPPQTTATSFVAETPVRPPLATRVRAAAKKLTSRGKK